MRLSDLAWTTVVSPNKSFLCNRSPWVNFSLRPWKILHTWWKPKGRSLFLNGCSFCMARFESANPTQMSSIRTCPRYIIRHFRNLVTQNVDTYEKIGVQGRCHRFFSTPPSQFRHYSFLSIFHVTSKKYPGRSECAGTLFSLVIRQLELLLWSFK